MTSNKRQIINTSIVFAALVFLSITFQNCTQQFETISVRGELSLSSTGVSNGVDQSLLNCSQSSSHDTCLFAKSPVAQTGRTVSEAELASLQGYGVKLTNQLSSQSLASVDLSVVDNNGQPVTSSTGWKFYFNTHSSQVLAVSAYYYAQNFKNWLKTYGGSSVLDSRGVKIYATSSDSGYFHRAKAIHLNSKSTRLPMALDASSVVNFMAQAHIAYSSSGKSLLSFTTQARECANTKGLLGVSQCCKTKSLCGPALNQGAADYLTALYLVDFGSTIGETWTNSKEGLEHCGIYRNPAANQSLNADNAYNACQAQGSAGSIHTMAALYSSIWWEARRKATSTTNFDRFFLAHLSQLSGDDSWNTVKAKLGTVVMDTDNHQEAYNLVLAEASSRGLQ